VALVLFGVDAGDGVEDPCAVGGEDGAADSGDAGEIVEGDGALGRRWGLGAEGEAGGAKGEAGREQAGCCEAEDEPG